MEKTRASSMPRLAPTPKMRWLKRMIRISSCSEDGCRAPPSCATLNLSAKRQAANLEWMTGRSAGCVVLERLQIYVVLERLQIYCKQKTQEVWRLQTLQRDWWWWETAETAGLIVWRCNRTVPQFSTVEVSFPILRLHHFLLTLETLRVEVDFFNLNVSKRNIKCFKKKH